MDNNSCYGRTLQSDERYGTSLIVTDQKEFMKKTIGKIISDFNVLAPCTNNNDGLVELKIKKSKVHIRSPKYLGSAILAYSKMLMLDFVYNCLAITFTSAEYDIFYTDTDSIYLGMKKETVFDYKSFLQCFDLYFKELHFAKDNDVTLGKMKLEKVLNEAIFLKPKLYTYIDVKQKQEIKTKGIRIQQNLEALTFTNYKKSLLENEKIQVHNQLFLKQNKTQMFTIKQTKNGITNDDNKREWININESLPYGCHSRIYNKDEVMERIINNCASRVNIEKDQFIVLLGCSVEQFQQQLELQMPPYCSFINYGSEWNIDHIRPVSDFKELTEHALRVLCHHLNLRPLTVKANSSKGGINRKK